MNKLPTVVNRRKSREDVYIGRGSKWGNPFPIQGRDTRRIVIEKYRRYLWEGIKAGKFSRSDFEALEGKRLGCFCKPHACHGDVIKSVCENLDKVFKN